MYSRRKGFTLIELLVVIAIIAILIGLLLPAVQKVRDAAARADCQNNLKQIGLALHAFHDTRKWLPPGGAADQPPHGKKAEAWGSSWRVYILPFIEQSQIYNQWLFNGGSGWGTSNLATPGNGTLTNGIKLSMYRCPASPLPIFCRSQQKGQVMASSYVGIAGAVNGLIPGHTETRIWTPVTSTADCCTGGIMSGGGILYANSQIRLVEISDGTSNTIMVGEQSDWLHTLNGTKVAWGATDNHGWYIGWRSTAQVTGPSGPSDQRGFGWQTIRYGLNKKSGWPNFPGHCGQTGVCNNSSENAPLNSPHSGGVNALFGDGSVRFLSDSLTLRTLAQMATRDDGIPMPNDFQ
jgi:prepilin-type N-terminal cleavage/methylation domain-containing protein/prepilin-type processing-associated H-X9-DG protein